uniref:Uncharacterized protein n=2 Tax=Esox lucius TaxID=8010 RepID=A0AAY5KNT3_ESOLU
MVDEFATVISMKSVMRAIYKIPFTCVSPCSMACPFLNYVLDEEALILRRAFRRERVFRDISDPLAFSDEYLHERYRFTGDGIRYCVALRFFRSGMFLYAVGHAEILNKGTICRCIRSVFGSENLGTHLYYLCWPQKNVLHQRDFYKIAGNMNYRLQKRVTLQQSQDILRLFCVTAWNLLFVQTAGSQNSALHSAKPCSHHPTDGLCGTAWCGMYLYYLCQQKILPQYQCSGKNVVTVN